MSNVNSQLWNNLTKILVEGRTGHHIMLPRSSAPHTQVLWEGGEISYPVAFTFKTVQDVDNLSKSIHNVLEKGPFLIKIPQDSWFLSRPLLSRKWSVPYNRARLNQPSFEFAKILSAVLRCLDSEWNHLP